MSNTIDLTGDDNDDGRRSEHNFQQQGGQRQRRRTTAPQSVTRPSNVYIVIHDKEPQDSGSDYRYSSMLPSRQDTTIVGVFYEYSSATRAAEVYVRNQFCYDEDEEGSDEDEGPFIGIDWQGEGWFRQEECDANECDDRVHIQSHRVR
ncbi:hypothetical protein ACHAWT_006378 [Skeletonema menzelii]